MRRLFPPPDPAAAGTEVDVARAYAIPPRPSPDGRPWVLLDMVASVDGATAAEGRSGGLGGAGDKAVFRSLRGIADVILVGSGTFTTEGYGPPRLAADLQQSRIQRGQPAQPRIAVATGRLGLDLAGAAFTDSPTRPIVVTVASADADRRAKAAAVADVLVCGPGPRIDLADAMGRLGQAGAAVVLCEGGPTLNADLMAAGLVDEICLTVSPLVAGGGSHRIIADAQLAAPVRFDLAHVLEQDDFLFLRYVRSAM